LIGLGTPNCRSCSIVNVHVSIRKDQLLVINFHDQFLLGRGYTYIVAEAMFKDYLIVTVTIFKNCLIVTVTLKSLILH